jgi:hypothetical protein
MWHWAEKNEGGISAPSETCKDIETDTARSCIHVYDGHESNRCLFVEKKFSTRLPAGLGPAARGLVQAQRSGLD